MQRLIIIICFAAASFLASATNSSAQSSVNCDLEMREANDLYARGQFDQTINLVDQCLTMEGIPEQERRAAYRLKGLSYIGKGLEGDAKASVRALLDFAPNYQPDPVLDPPDFVSLVAEIRAERGPEPQQATSNPPSTQSNQANFDREGFTLLLSLGLGYQAIDGESETGLGGLNIGLGGFINDNLAVMGRISGTNVSESEASIEVSLLSGTFGVTLQYWINDKLYVEGGPGLGFARVEVSVSGFGSATEDETGFGFIVGGGFVLFNKGKNNIHIGVEYAPAFVESFNVNNIGLTVGYQLL